ncbi:hypothetical protein [Kitasatospora sp. CB01950]|uniref:hypothetical protein n=1 Tax=Kitasatospora sp. CB01950 TaxID=1703930 RepID=UPI00093EBB02|nr:hypothetical protein [Kitasatospora sp. CB01950]OKI95078.1 hypothetical protein AMK19_32930 [Kitasatospora sp. CB01950]
MNFTDTAFTVFFTGSAVTAAMVLTAEAVTTRVTRRAAAPLPSVTVHLTFTAPVVDADLVEREAGRA